MTVRSFVDTNVLVYADDRSAGSKRQVARELLVRALRSRHGVLSLQVLQEYYATATRRLGIPKEAARSRVELFGRLDIVSLDLGDLLAAIDLHRLHSLAIWDALIVRGALISDCRVLFSEDMQHGRRFESLEIVDPFR